MAEAAKDVSNDPLADFRGGVEARQLVRDLGAAREVFDKKLDQFAENFSRSIKDDGVAV